MARRKSVSYIRDIGVDARFGSADVQKLINVIMERGKKAIARSIVYQAFDILKQKAGGDEEKALQTFKRALDNILPAIEVKPRRVGGSVYQVPTAVEPRRAQSLAYRWLKESAATRRQDKSMGIKIGNELSEAAEGRGNAVKKKIDMHKMAEANRAFSHFHGKGVA